MNQKTPFIFYGGDYNPDQWDDATMEEDMRLFKKAHVNLVTLPVFSWAKLEPAEGQYDFGWLDRILEKLRENRIYVCLATPTAAQPAWMSRKYPDMLPVDVEGRRRNHGKRVNFCPNSDKYRELSGKIAAEMAVRYRSYPGLVLWHVANEYGTYCYCERCASKFREWLRKRYGTVWELNKRWNLSFWGHTVYSFEEVNIPSELNDDNKWYQPKMLDYMRFMTDSNLECFLNEYTQIKNITPDIPVTTNISGFIKNIDQYRLVGSMDVAGWDNYPSPLHDRSLVAMKHDLMRSLKGGKPFLLMEQSPNQQNWQPYNKLKKPGEVRLLSYQALARGADSVLFFQMRQSIAGVEKLHGALISHAGHENTRVFRECRQLGAELERMKGEFLGSRIKARVAFIFDWDNWWAVELSSGPSKDMDYLSQVNKYYRAFYKKNIPVDFIPAGADLSGYDIVVAPLLYMVKQETGENLKIFVKNGGTFVATFFSGIVDENDRVVLGGYPGKLKEILGIWVEETDALFPEEHNEMVVTDTISGTGLLKGKAYRCGLICDIVHLKGAKALAVYGSDFYRDVPCVTKNTCEKGLAYYVATDPEEDFVDDFVKMLCLEKNIGPLLEAPDGIEITERQGENASYTFVINHRKNEVEIELPDENYRNLLNNGKTTGVLRLGLRDIAVLKHERRILHE